MEDIQLFLNSPVVLKWHMMALLMFSTTCISCWTLFKPEKTILTSKAYKVPELIVEEIKLRPNANWKTLRLYCNYEDNKKLSLLRAEAVYNYFVSNGIPPEKFEVIGRGEDFPIANNGTEKGRKKIVELY